MKINIIVLILALGVSIEGHSLSTSDPARKNIFKNVCEKNGGNFTEYTSAYHDFIRCMDSGFELYKMQTALNEAIQNRSSRSFSNIMKTYCPRIPKLKACYHKLGETASKCVGTDQGLITVFRDSLDVFLDYLCEYDGQIVMRLIMEGGVDCLENKWRDITECFERSQRYIDREEYFNLDGAEQMTVAGLICAIHVLENCDTQIPLEIFRRAKDTFKNTILLNEFYVKSNTNTSQHVPARHRDHRHRYSSTPEGSDVLAQLCEKNGGNYSAFRETNFDFFRCMDRDFQMNKFDFEVKAASLNKTYNSYTKIIEKYCPRVPKLQACYHKVAELASPCLGSEQRLITVFNNVHDQLLNYLCENDGHILLKLFIEDGAECFENKRDELISCLTSSESYMNTLENFNLLGAENMYNKALNCGIGVLQNCDSQIPTKIVERIIEIFHENIALVKSNSTKVAAKDLKNEANSSQHGTPSTGVAKVEVSCGQNGVHAITKDPNNTNPRKLTKTNIVVSVNTDIYV